MIAFIQPYWWGDGGWLAVATVKCILLTSIHIYMYIYINADGSGGSSQLSLSTASNTIQTRFYDFRIWFFFSFLPRFYYNFLSIIFYLFIDIQTIEKKIVFIILRVEVKSETNA